ncbi:MAG TPA: hypothetical protein VGL22_17985 [Terracidiphilus sp.]|jgi:hypothetical protein
MTQHIAPPGRYAVVDRGPLPGPGHNNSSALLAGWVIALAMGGFFGNFVLSLTDHASNGFFAQTDGSLLSLPHSPLAFCSYRF